MLRTLPELKKRKWDESLNKMIHAYDCTKHEATGFTPYYLLFGRNPRLPIDLIFNFNQDKDGRVDYNSYVRKWREDMDEAYQIAQKTAKKAARHSKDYYDRRVSGGVRERGAPGKLRSHWEETIHVIAERLGGDSPVHRLKPENGRGRARVLHRNLLLPCDELELGSSVVEPVHQARRTITSSALPPKTSDGLSSEDESDDLTETRLVGYSQETGSSNSSCSEPNEPLDQAEIVPTTDVDLIIGSENRSVDEEFSDLDVSTEESVSTRPQHQCRPPQIFTYNSLGNPEYQRVNPLVKYVQMPWTSPPALPVPYHGPFYYWTWPQVPYLPLSYC